jgi:hypothetical protein
VSGLFHIVANVTITDQSLACVIPASYHTTVLLFRANVRDDPLSVLLRILAVGVLPNDPTFASMMSPFVSWVTVSLYVDRDNNDTIGVHVFHQSVLR